MHKFNESYTIKAVLALQPGHMVDHAADVIEECYQEGNIAGSFRAEQIGALAVFTFIRDIGEDAEVLGGLTEVEPMTPVNVANQLYREFAEAAPDNRGSQHYVQQVLNSLEGGQYRVEGLPCQYPALEVRIAAYFPNDQIRVSTQGMLEHLFTQVITTRGGTVGAIKIEAGGAEAIAAEGF